MPQLETTTFAPQLVWLAITFIIFYVLMAKLALPRIGGAIERRRNRIETDLGEARRLKAEAETVLAAYERALAEARAEAQAGIRETMDRLSHEAAERQREAAAKIAAETAAAEARIAAARAAALANVRNVAVDIARVAASRLIGIEPEEALAASAVDTVLKERA